MQVIDLGKHRGLLKSWDEAQAHMRSGRAKGFALMVMGQDGEEAVYLGGEYKDNEEAAARVGLRLSLAVVQKTGT